MTIPEVSETVLKPPIAGLSFVPQDVLGIMGKIHRAGFEVWLVGGALRDFFLGLEPRDWDLATGAGPEQIMEIFPRVIPVGIRHGTVQVHTRTRDIEVTSYTPPGPDGIAKDLGRRDFTMNAMAFSYPDGMLLDPFGGRVDLGKKLIRGVDDPRARFAEDPLRIVRAGRLAGVYGFSVEKATFDAMREEAENVANVSGERIRDEIFKILLSSDPIGAFDLLRKGWTLGKLLHELVVREHVENVPGSGISIYRYSLDCVRNSPLRLRVRLAALLRRSAVPAAMARDNRRPRDFNRESALAALTRMKKWNMSNRQMEDVASLIEHQLPPGAVSWSDAEIRKFMAGVRPELLDDFVALAEAESLTEGGTDPDVFRNLSERMHAQLARNAALTIQKLAVDGRDIMDALGVERGPVVGSILKKLLALVLENPDLNTRECLLAIVKKDREGRPAGN